MKTEADFKTQMWIEEHTRVVRCTDHATAYLQGDGREGLCLGMLVPRGKSAYQALIELQAGTATMAYAEMDFPDTVEALWRTMAANDIAAVRLAVDSPYDYFITWEDSSTQNYSPATYGARIASCIGEWSALLRDAGKHYVQHACGHVRDLVVPMKQSGILAVESLSPPPTGNLPLAEARSLVGAAFGIIGGIEPTRFLNLSLDQLGPYVEQVIADGQGGPFVLANSDSCPPGVTLEKFKRCADVAKATSRISLPLYSGNKHLFKKVLSENKDGSAGRLDFRHHQILAGEADGHQSPAEAVPSDRVMHAE